MLKLGFLFRGGNLLTLLTVTGVGIGLGLGIGLRSSSDQKWFQRNAMYLKFPGELFLRTLSGLILPLIFSSLVAAIGSVDLQLSKKIGTRALVYYLGTSVGAAILGTSLVHFVSPGTKAEEPIGGCGVEGDTSTIDTLLDLIRNVLPPNIVGAALQNTQTVITGNTSLPFEERSFEIQLKEGTNMVGLIVFALTLGITLASLEEVGKPLLIVFNSMATATLKIASKLIWAGPLASCFLIAGQMVELDSISEVFQTLSWYVGTALGAYLFHGFVVLPLLYTIVTRKLPFRFINDIRDVIFTAFGTSSSLATLPVTLKCLEEKCKIDTRITRFVIPIGAAVNMDGTTLGLILRVIYIAQLCGRTLDFGDLLTIILTSVAAGVGIAGIPVGGATVAGMTMLASMGIPTEKIALVFPVEWLLGRVATVVNVIGDALGSAIIGHLGKEDLAKVPLAPPVNNAMTEVETMERHNGKCDNFVK